VEDELELDLRKYVNVLFRHWKMIAALTLVAASVPLVVSLLMPPTYQATAMCVATNPKYTMQFDVKFQSVVNLQVPSKAYAAIAKNAQLEKQIMAALGDSLPARLRSVEALDGACSVSSGSDPSVIRLDVRYRDPQVAADIANTWATLYVGQINALYGQSAQDVQQIDEQVKTVSPSLQAAEQALIEFQKVNPSNVMSKTIEAQSKAFSDYIAAETNVQLALQDAQSLEQQLQAAGTAPPGLASSLSALLTELNALGAQRDLGTQIQITLAASMGGDTTIPQQIQSLDNLMTALKAKEQALAVARAEIPAKIMQAQGELQQAQAEQDRLQRARDVARDTYVALTRKADELRIATQVEPNEVRVVSPAEVPVKPVSPKKALNTAVAGVLGLMAGVLGALATEYFGRPGGPIGGPAQKGRGVQRPGE
jgi:uncharacterized protein involved in exopolysaccharide biosynthesis